SVRGCLAVLRGRFGPVRRAELAHDALHVILDREWTDRKQPGDVRVGAADGYQAQDLDFARARAACAGLSRRDFSVPLQSGNPAERRFDLADDRVDAEIEALDAAAVLADRST